MSQRSGVWASAMVASSCNAKRKRKIVIFTELGRIYGVMRIRTTEEIVKDLPKMILCYFGVTFAVAVIAAIVKAIF